MSERATQFGIARARAGAVVGPQRGRSAEATTASTTTATEAAVRAALATVMDPELPMVSIVDLGMVGDVSVDTAIHVDLLPTFVGCPAIDMIRRAVEERLAALGLPVEVATTFEPAWSSERISAAGRQALAAAGIAPPVEPDAMRCPWCGALDVVMDGLFGPTQCRSLYYCRSCRQPFEAIKVV